MTKTRLVLVIFLIVGLCGCKQASGDERAKALMRAANDLLAQDAKLADAWINEYQKAFRPEERAKFPSNRDSLRVHADKIITILDESSALVRTMAEKYEEASTLATKDQERKGVSSIAAALRKNLEVQELLKSQMQLVSDEQIKDEKTFNEKFMQLVQQINQKNRENEDLRNEGKQLLGIK